MQLRRYESGSSQPTLDVIRHLAVALSVSADLLLFGESQGGPDEDLRLQFEAVSQFDSEEKKVVRSLLDGMILKHEARTLVRTRIPRAQVNGALGRGSESASRRNRQPGHDMEEGVVGTDSSIR